MMSRGTLSNGEYWLQVCFRAPFKLPSVPDKIMSNGLSEKEFYSKAKNYLRNYIEPILSSKPRSDNDTAIAEDVRLHMTSFASLVADYVSIVSQEKLSARNFWLSVALAAFAGISALGVIQQIFHVIS